MAATVGTGKSLSAVTIAGVAGGEIGDIFFFARKDLDELEDIRADDKSVFGAGDEHAVEAGRFRNDFEGAAELAESQPVELVHRLRFSIESQVRQVPRPALQP